MKSFAFLPAVLSVFAFGSGSGKAAVVALATGANTEAFSSLASGLPSGWDVRTGATASALGSAAAFVTAATSWATATGQFRNSASATGLSANANAAAQTAAANRALGIRQSGSFGDPGASFNFNFSTINLGVSSISLDLQMLAVDTRSTTWSIQYGVGAAPTSWATLGTYSDPGAFGSTTRTYTTADFGTALNNSSNLWFRVVALGASTGTGSRDGIAIDNFSIMTVPEPQTAVLMGAMGVICLVRRRQAEAV